MKRILLILSAVLLLASCGKKNGGETELTLEQKLSTEWHSTSITVDGDVYIDFKADHTFELYQRIGEGAYRLYRGSWGLEGNLLTGRYNDGEEWASAYNVETDGDSLTLTSNNSTAEKSVYERESIPEEVKNNCIIEVKSNL